MVAALAGTILSAIGMGINAAQTGKQNKQRQALEDQQLADARRDLLFAENRDYSNSPALQGNLKLAMEAARKRWGQTDGTQALSGATDEASAMAKADGTSVVSNVLTQGAQQSEVMRENKIQAGQQRYDAAVAGKVGSLNQSSANTAQAAGTLVNAAMGLAGTDIGKPQKDVAGTGTAFTNKMDNFLEKSKGFKVTAG